MRNRNTKWTSMTRSWPDGLSCDGGSSRRGGWVDRCRRGDGLRRGADSRAVADQRPNTMLIAQGHVPAGTSPADAVAKGLLVPTQDAASGVPVRSLDKADEATGKLVALTDIAPGECVLASRFESTPLGQKAIQAPDGQAGRQLCLAVRPRPRTHLCDSWFPHRHPQHPCPGRHEQFGGRGQADTGAAGPRPSHRGGV
jgi:hypothetical protein